MLNALVKTRLIPTLGLIAALLASCAPAAVTEAPGADQPPMQEPASPFVVEPSATPAVSAATESPVETAAPTPLPVATSRGPNLEATDPGTVSLTSGGLQFVEFFRFT
ncbi:MAG: hypothetical protein L6Q26_11460 [Anaerolineales bacterium]|nr:hypothetical protein [Anaerolineales bacterium]NUQ84267.1 hypothetical protein [Anaerolineales bacterium]